MERCTIHTGHTIAHSPSGLLGQGPARWPKPTVYGQPTTHEVRPVRNQRIVRGHCGQVRPAPPTWCGVLWHVEGYRGQGLRQILPRYSGYTETKMRRPKKGCSPVRQSGRWQPMALRVEMTPKSVKVLVARLPSYT
jgi:hypothetical protein